MNCNEARAAAQAAQDAVAAVWARQPVQENHGGQAQVAAWNAWQQEKDAAEQAHSAAQDAEWEAHRQAR